MINRSRGTLSVAIGAAFTLGVGLLAASPAMAASTDAAPESARHCVLVLAPLEKGETHSKVLSETCGETKAMALEASTADASAADIDLFMMAEHSGWGGEYYWVRGGAACDNAGYSFTPSGWWQIRLSSSSYENGCDRMNIQNSSGNRANGIASHRDTMPLGFNDNVTFINFYNG
ncbi:hypothetical protein ACO229_11485 [Promicromonospora sp. MS192]|uniref:hypothetical protein n=1 Tax=Promicromonospora sp. MS192 TaxID=3412684 RepID=UPI003C2CCDF0